MYQINQDNKEIFVKNLLDWFKENKRDFIWRKTVDPYHIIVAEIMLQKTDARKVELVYQPFIKKYPDIVSLANAEVNQIKNDIKGLGIYKRAERMKNLAITIIKEYDGEIPNDKEELMSLNGVGHYISNAVLCFAFDEDVPLVDTNSIRVLERVFLVKTNKSRARTDGEIWSTLESIIPKNFARDFNLAIIDFSALVCTSNIKTHENCPLKDICSSYNSQ